MKMLAQRIRKYLLYNHRMSCGGQEEPPSSKERENVSATSTTQPAQVEYKKNSGDITKNEAKMLSAKNRKMTEWVRNLPQNLFLGEKYVAQKERKIIPKIVDTSFHWNA